MILFKNCRLIPELTEGFNFEAGSLADIWVSDNWVIESIAPAGATNAADAQVVDAEGGTLLPGFLICTRICA